MTLVLFSRAVADAMDFIGMVQSYLPDAKPTDNLRKHIALLQPDLWHWQNPLFLRRVIDKHLEIVPYMRKYIQIIRRWVCAVNHSICTLFTPH